MCAQDFITIDHPQFRHTRIRAPHLENTTGTINTIITHKYNKYIQPLPAWLAIAFDLVFLYCRVLLITIGCVSFVAESCRVKLSPAAA